MEAKVAGVRLPKGIIKKEDGEKPEEPHESECCGNGCQDCVWVTYWEALQEWENAKKG